LVGIPSTTVRGYLDPARSSLASRSTRTRMSSPWPSRRGGRSGSRRAAGGARPSRSRGAGARGSRGAGGVRRPRRRGARASAGRRRGRRCSSGGRAAAAPTAPCTPRTATAPLLSPAPLARTCVAASWFGLASRSEEKRAASCRGCGGRKRRRGMCGLLR
jgi:hypothetical protein